MSENERKDSTERVETWEEIQNVIAEEKIAKLEDNEREQKKKNKKLKNKVGNRNITIIALIVIIIILLLKSCSADGGRILPDLVDAGFVQQEEVPDVEHIEGTTAIPVITDFTVSKNYPYATLYNPESNAGYSYLQYQFTDLDSGEVIYESKLVDAGKMFSVPFGELLDEGTYNVGVNIFSWDYEDPTVQKNGGYSEIKVTITK